MEETLGSANPSLTTAITASFAFILKLNSHRYTLIRCKLWQTRQHKLPPFQTLGAGSQGRKNARARRRKSASTTLPLRLLQATLRYLQLTPSLRFQPRLHLLSSNKPSSETTLFRSTFQSLKMSRHLHRRLSASGTRVNAARGGTRPNLDEIGTGGEPKAKNLPEGKCFHAVHHGCTTSTGRHAPTLLRCT